MRRCGNYGDVYAGGGDGTNGTTALGSATSIVECFNKGNLYRNGLTTQTTNAAISAGKNGLVTDSYNTGNVTVEGA
jgi:hypothetical protein